MKFPLILNKVGFWVVFALMVLLPLFFLPITSEFYDFNKHILLILASSILLITWVLAFVFEKQVRITRNPLGLPLLSILAVWIISTLSQTPNRMDVLLEPGSTVSLIAMAIFFSTSLSFIKTKNELNLLVNGLIGSFSVLAAVSLIWGSGLMGKIIPWVFAQSPVWSPAGNPLTVLVSLLVLIPLVTILIVKQKENSPRVLTLSIVLFLFVVTSGLITYRVFKNPSNRPIFLSQTTSWAIAMESLKLSPLFGTGPSTYLSDFTRFKPVTFNLTPNWAIRFTSASNYYLQILTTTGLLGLVSILYLVYKVIDLLVRSLKSAADSQGQTPALAAGASSVLIFATFLFLPPSITTLFLLFSLLTILVTSFKLMGSSLVHEAHIDIVAASDSGVRTPILPWISLILALGLVLPTAFTYVKAYAADVVFQTGLVAATKNDGRKTYESIIKAINLNPYRDTYHIAASQTDLLLANSAATKKDLTNDDRTLITNLVQQSIQEAKNAVALNPTKVTNVENLAAIYQNLLNFAQGADQWALASYQQAVSLDPTNPGLRISLGGIYFAQKNYDEAIRAFQQAADLKPDFANSYYNISAAYKEKKDYTNAYAAMQAVVAKIDKTSPDYLKAQGELEALAKLAGTQAAQTPTTPAPTQLEAPKPLPTSKVNPPITLPSNLGPATTSATPPLPKP
jgi:tetratricopeptide (TPR) repeat protein